MKSFATLFLSFFVLTMFGQPWICYTDDLVELNQTNPTYGICSGDVLQNPEFEYVIPTVVHVIHNNGPENISDQQIMNALNDCNEGFWWQAGVGQNLNIKLALARKDEFGNCTNGINRVQMDKIVVGLDFAPGFECEEIIGYSDLTNQLEWNNDQYLNIYVVAGLTDDQECFIPEDGIYRRSI
jgi:hypothetical protein